MRSGKAMALAMLGSIGLLSSGLAQDCTQCVYYEVKHFSRIEDHPDLGEWDEILEECVNIDKGRDFRVTADGTVASKFEVRLIDNGCDYMRTDPIVQFVTMENEDIQNPTPEEHGVIQVIGMTPTSVFFEYTHPTDLPAADSLKRQVRIAIKDSSEVNEEYLPVCWLNINVHREPVILVHGLWSNGPSFNVMQSALEGAEYLDPMVYAVDYSSTNGSYFSVNANVVPNGINTLINDCRDSDLSAGKVNIVCHSMGGILSRLYLQNSFRNDVHRLITCNTPHSGSQVANFIYDAFFGVPLIAYQGILFGLFMPWDDGAITDLQVGSDAIEALNAGSHPPGVGVHALTTTEDPPDVGIPEEYFGTKVKAATKVSYLMTSCSASFLDSIFNLDQHDLIVAQASQEGGLFGDYISHVADQQHVGSMENSAVIDKVRELLNEPVSSSKFTTGGYAPYDLEYNNNANCLPIVFGDFQEGQNRSSTCLAFGQLPSQQVHTGGDTIAISVSGIDADTIVLMIELSIDSVYMVKKPGPAAEFIFGIPETQSGTFGVVAFAYSAAGELICTISDSLLVEPAYYLTGISVHPAVLYGAVGDTIDFEITGHYSDAVDRPLNGDPDLNFNFTTWSATPTSTDDILMLYPNNDTLYVTLDAFISPMVRIFHWFTPALGIYWLGGTGTWDEDAKWSIGAPPGPGTTAYILTGDCTIPDTLNAGVAAIEVNGATFTINGQLAVEGSPSTAVKVDKATLVNNGTLEVSNVNNTALWLTGTSSDSPFVVNNGEMQFNVCGGTYGLYISTNTHFLNDTSGIVGVVDCGLNSSVNVSSGSSGFSFDNRGEFSVNGGPVDGVGRLRNAGVFELAHTVPDTYEGLRCAFLHNTAAGEMLIGNVFNNALAMSFSTDSVVNEGSIVIDNTNFTGMRVANTINKGSIQIRNTVAEAIDLEGNNFYFLNDSTGILSIMNAPIGIYTRNTGCEFDNLGSIAIDSVGIGIQVRFNSVFTSEESGRISITNCDTRGVDVLDNTSTIFNNNGILDISASGGNGIHVSTNGIFNNLNAGEITISDVTGSALATSGNILHGNTTILNQGMIDVELPIGSYAIDHTKRFTNDTCGIFTTEKPLRVAAGNFINHGFMHLLNTAAHTFTGSNKIVNNGWIDDFEGLLDVSTQTTNSGVVAAPVDYGGCTGEVINDLFAIGDLSRFELSDGHADKGLSVSAGEIDTMNNTFTPNADGVLAVNWFFEVTRVSAGCLDTTALQARVTCPVNCAETPLFWTGCTDSTWGAPDNWSTGAVPVATDTVTVTGLPAGAVFPEIIDLRSVQHINLSHGADLTIKSGGELRVEGE